MECGRRAAQADLAPTPLIDKVMRGALHMTILTSTKEHRRHGRKITFLSTLFLLAVPLVIMAGCSEEYATFSKYGFSFEYPADFTVSEFGIEEAEANDISGAVQVRVERGSIRAFQVNWLETWIYGLESSLQNAFAGMERAEGVENVDRGELREGNKDGNRMLYQHYGVTTTGGEKAYGIAGAFYYPESHKLFTLVTRNSNVIAYDDVLDDFNTYLDSFTYQEPE